MSEAVSDNFAWSPYNDSLTSQTCTLAAARVFKYTRDPYTGKIASAMDADNGTTMIAEYSTTSGYDWLARPTKMTGPLGAITSYQYFDATRYALTTATLDSRPIPSVTSFDQIGWSTGSVTSESDGAVACRGSPTAIQSQQQYQYVAGVGRYEWVSNPYRSTSDGTMGWTRRKYDTAGRLVEVGHCSGNQQNTQQSKVTSIFQSGNEPGGRF
jgi:hypothetical protein